MGHEIKGSFLVSTWMYVKNKKNKKEGEMDMIVQNADINLN